MDDIGLDGPEKPAPDGSYTRYSENNAVLSSDISGTAERRESDLVQRVDGDQVGSILDVMTTSKQLWTGIALACP